MSRSASGMRQRDQVVIALEVVVPALEALAAEIGLGQLQVLDLRPHRTVEDEDALGSGLAQGALDLGAVGGSWL
jgi:hypothetical protein